MKIRDKLGYETKPKPVTFRASDKVQAALEEMVARKIGSVVITDEAGRVAGILTERDMMNRVLFAKKDPTQTPISEVMTSVVRIAQEDDSLIDWLQIMSNERFRHLPVVDEKGHLVSIMSQGDFVAYTWPDLLNNAKEGLKRRFGTPLQIAMVVVAVAIIAYMLANKF